MGGLFFFTGKGGENRAPLCAVELRKLFPRHRWARRHQGDALLVLRIDLFRALGACAHFWVSSSVVFVPVATRCVEHPLHHGRSASVHLTLQCREKSGGRNLRAKEKGKRLVMYNETFCLLFVVCCFFSFVVVCCSLF